MMSALLPEMAQQSFQPLINRLEEERAYSAEELRDLLAATHFGAAILEKAWEILQCAVSRGIELSRLLASIKEFKEIITSASELVYPAVEQLTKERPLPAEEKSESLRRLNEISVRAHRMLGELTALQRWLETPPDIDVAALIGGRAKDERYVDLEIVQVRERSQ